MWVAPAPMLDRATRLRPGHLAVRGRAQEWSCWGRAVAHSRTLRRARVLRPCAQPPPTHLDPAHTQCSKRGCRRCARRSLAPRNIQRPPETTAERAPGHAAEPRRTAEYGRLWRPDPRVGARVLSRD